MKQYKFYVILAIVVALVTFLSTFTVCGCKTFKPTVYDGVPDECNDWYNVLAWSYAKESDSGLAGIVYTDCKAAREAHRRAQREVECKKLYFKDGVVDTTDYPAYTEYLKCVSSK